MFEPSRQAPLLSTIMNCLELKKPDHHPNVPHKVEEVYEAAHFVLQGYSSFTQNLIAAATTQPTEQLQLSSASSTPKASKPTAKAEDFNSLIGGFTKLIIEAIHSTQPCGQPCHNHNGKIECNYCGEEHFICDCPHVLTDIKAGKCRRNQDGKVVLSTGTFVPQDITGKFLCDHIDEWHRQNSNRLATATLMHTIDRWIVEEQKPPPVNLYTSLLPPITSQSWKLSCSTSELGNESQPTPIALALRRPGTPM